jgi:hypothetical protein
LNGHDEQELRGKSAGPETRQMVEISNIARLPAVPAVYALYGGRGAGLYVAYVGLAGNLKLRIVQHLVRRDSSVVVGTAAVVLNPEHVTEARSWVANEFIDRHVLKAAELIAFDILDPALRSRGAVDAQARALYEETSFRERMGRLFIGEPAGRLTLPSLPEVYERLLRMEQRLAALEAKLSRGS